MRQTFFLALLIGGLSGTGAARGIGPGGAGMKRMRARRGTRSAAMFVEAPRGFAESKAAPSGRRATSSVGKWM